MIDSPPFACCSFPTQIVIVDDEPAMADSLQLSIGPSLVSYTDPTQALAALSAYRPSITEEIWLHADQTSDLWDGFHTQPITLDIKKILSIASQPVRLNDISVVIVDYRMPNCNGLQLLEKLQNQPFKKILLTAEGTDHLAIDAFNRGLIDQFLRKDDAQLHEKLAEIVARLKQCYFADLCKRSLTFLAQNSRVFSHAGAAEFFYQTLVEMRIQEFYLLDLQGGFRLIDKTHSTQYWLLYSEEYVEMIAQYAQDNQVPASVVETIRQKERFPFFGELKTYWQIPPQEWGHYLHSLQAIKAKGERFYVVAIQ